MEGCERTLESCLHLKTHLFRPPRGDWNPTIYREACAEQDDIILWDVSVEHQSLHTPRAMAEHALRQIRPGSIVLMHDGAFVSRESTVQALPMILEGLQAKGYRVVTVPELLHIPGDDLLPPWR
jgi:peptidoglycan/xylan/chitin deacetylase (PgdA/CDA1 family)